MKADPYRGIHGESLPPARPPQDEHRRPSASTFDRLVEATLASVESNAALTKNVGKLVRVTYAVIALNLTLVAIVILILWRHS